MTFSIVALDKHTGALGVATASASLAVGSRVPFVGLHIGAIATQAATKTMYGYMGLDLLKEGKTADEALEEIMNRDPMPDHRQVLMVDHKGASAGWTGKETVNWSGHKTFEDFAVGGNMLAGEKVLDAMIETFQNSTEENFAQKLLDTLRAADEAGGDKRGKQSAALKVFADSDKRFWNLRADDDPRPLDHLQRLLDKWQEEINA